MFCIPSLHTAISDGLRTLDTCVAIDEESLSKVDLGLDSSKANLITARTMPETMI